MHTVSEVLRYSERFDAPSIGVSWVVCRSLNAVCALVSSGQTGKLSVLDVTIKYKSLRLIGVYAPNNHTERLDLLRIIEPLLMASSGQLKCRH